MAETAAAPDGAAEGKTDDEAILKAAREAFAEAVEAERDNRRDALDDIRFARLGEQWPEEAIKARGKDRPMLTINKLPAFLRQVVNEGRMNRPAIKISPADDSADVPTAHVMSGLIRNIEYTSNADVAYDTALEQACDGGWGYLAVRLDYAAGDTFEMDLSIERIADRFRVYGDPRSTGADTGDWNVAFITDTMSLDAFNAAYKGKKPVSWEDDGYSDIDADWRDGDDVRVAEYWTRDLIDGEIIRFQAPDGTERVFTAEQAAEKAQALADAGFAEVERRTVKRQKVTQRIITGAEILETHDEWPGQYIPISVCYGDEVQVNGKRHLRSLIRDAKDSQRQFNYWQSTATENVALSPKAPFIGPKGVFSDPKWKTANSELHPYLEFDAKVLQQAGLPVIPPQRQQYAGMPAAELQLALGANDNMKSVIGIYDASLGARSNETSGVAISARQREGDVSTFHFIDNLGRCIRHTGRILVDLIPKIYTPGRIVRVMGVDGTPQNVQLGQPKPGQQPRPIKMPDGSEVTQIFDLTLGKYDLTVETGPSFTTKRQEAAAQMTEFVRAFPNAVPLIGDLIAKNLDWPGADEIAARLKAMLPPQLQGENPQAQALQQQMQQMDAQAREAVGQLQQELQACQQQLQKAESKAEVQQIQAEIEKLDKQLEKRELDIKLYGEVTKRLQAGMPAMPGAEGDPDMAAIAGQADQQQQATQQDAAQRTEQAAQLVVQAVQALEQMVQRLEQPRAVQRDQDGLLLTH
jgi:hypothetical protein